MTFIGKESMIKAQEKGRLTEKAYIEALKNDQKLSREPGIDAAMDKKKLDALITPTGGPAWITDLITGDPFGGGYSTASAVAGYPHITVPAGVTHNLPVGISFFGRAYSEAALIKIAYAYEQATQHPLDPA